jgi:hypothetical protein
VVPLQSVGADHQAPKSASAEEGNTLVSVSKRARNLSFVATCSLLIGSITGCAWLPLEDQVDVDFSGPFLSEVHACVVVASNGDLRDDPKTPSGLRVDQIVADPQGLVDGIRYYSISGRLVVSFSGQDSTEHTWACEVSVGNVGGKPTLTAVLNSFRDL